MLASSRENQMQSGKQAAAGQSHPGCLALPLGELAAQLTERAEFEESFNFRLLNFQLRFGGWLAYRL